VISAFVPTAPRAILDYRTHGIGHRRNKALSNALDVGAELTQKIGIRHRSELIRCVPGVNVRLFVELRGLG